MVNFLLIIFLAKILDFSVIRSIVESHIIIFGQILKLLHYFNEKANVDNSSHIFFSSILFTSLATSHRVIGLGQKDGDNKDKL